MKIPNRIIGFISHEDKDFPFEFDKKKFLLKFYYPTESDAYKHIFDRFMAMSFDLKKHEWIPKIQFTGKTAEGYLVVFGTTDNPNDYHGYRTYSVGWFYISSDDSETIDEIIIQKTINQLFHENLAI